MDGVSIPPLNCLFPCTDPPLAIKSSRLAHVSAAQHSGTSQPCSTGSMLCRFALLSRPRAFCSAVAIVHSIAFSAVTKFSCDTRRRSDSSSFTATDLPPGSITSCSRAEEVPLSQTR